MKIANHSKETYYNWLLNKVCYEEEHYNFSILLEKLYETEFVAIIPRDENRIADGLAMRTKYLERFSIEDPDFLSDKPCSILEMMIALSYRCENQIMEDDNFGNRTGQWFWEMIDSLGLSGMSDDSYDGRFVDKTLDIFLNRKYRSNGEGGLFTVQNPPKPVQKVEIWYQMNWYLVQNYM